MDRQGRYALRGRVERRTRRGGRLADPGRWGKGLGVCGFEGTDTARKTAQVLVDGLEAFLCCVDNALDPAVDLGLDGLRRHIGRGGILCVALSFFLTRRLLIRRRRGTLEGLHIRTQGCNLPLKAGHGFRTAVLGAFEPQGEFFKGAVHGPVKGPVHGLVQDFGRLLVEPCLQVLKIARLKALFGLGRDGVHLF